MNLLTDDMMAAVEHLSLSDRDKELITIILYQERLNKERDWEKDAEAFIMKKIDDSELETI